MVAEATAIAQAERFVIANGYTDLPATNKGDSLSVESLDHFEPEKRLAERKGTLLPNACAVMEGMPGEQASPVWTVVFCYNPKHPECDTARRELGRMVVVERDGSRIWMEHNPVRLNAPRLRKL